LVDGDEGTVYFEGNALIPDDTPLNDDAIEYESSPLNQPSGVSESELFATDELESVLSDSVGPRPADRPPHDKRIVNDFVGRGGGIIDDESDVGGYPELEPTTRELSVPDGNLAEWIREFTVAVESV
jgi:hypothetical protein